MIGTHPSELSKGSPLTAFNALLKPEISKTLFLGGLPNEVSPHSSDLENQLGRSIIQTLLPDFLSKEVHE